MPTPTPLYPNPRASNLRVQLRELRTMLGEPNDYAFEDTSAPGDGYHVTLDLVDFIHRAELRVVDEVGIAAIGSLLTTCDRTTVDGTNTYALPATDPLIAEWPVERLIQIEMDAGAGWLVPCDVVKIDTFREMTQDGNILRSVFDPLVALMDDSTLIVNPTPGGEAGASKLRFHYQRLPRKRWRHHHGIVGTSTPTTVVDTDQPYSLDNFYTLEGAASLRVVEGLATSKHIGKETLVTGYTASTKTIIVSGMGGALTAGDHYVVGELSDLNPILADISLRYAAYLGFMKERDYQQASMQESDFNRSIARHVQSRKRKVGRPVVIRESREGAEW